LKTGAGSFCTIINVCRQGYSREDEEKDKNQRCFHLKKPLFAWQRSFQAIVINVFHPMKLLDDAMKYIYDADLT